MAFSLKHLFASAKPDSGDATLVQPSNWNEEHAITSDVGTLLGTEAGEGGDGTVVPITVGSGLSLAGTTLTATGGGGGLPLQLPIRSAAFYATWYADRLVDAAPDDVADAIFAVPFVCSEAKTWTRIGFNQVTGVDATSARLGIYTAHATTGFPDELVVDAGTISTAAASDGTDREITISQALAANTIYWLAFVAEDPLVMLKMMAESDASSVINDPGVHFATGRATSTGRAPLGGYSTTTAFGALPDPFPDFNGMADGGTMPYIWLRVV
jgi:hypothetical protein